MKKTICNILSIAAVILVAGCGAETKVANCTDCHFEADSLICEEAKKLVAEFDSEELVAEIKSRHSNLGSGYALGDVNITVEFNSVSNSMKLFVVKLDTISPDGLYKEVDTLETYQLRNQTVELTLGGGNQVLIVNYYAGNSLKWTEKDSLGLTSSNFDAKVIPSYGGVGTPAFIGNQDARDDQVSGASNSLLINLDYNFWKPRKMRLWYNANTRYLHASCNNTDVSKIRLHPGYVGSICFGTNFNQACH